MERPSRSAHVYKAMKAQIRAGAYLPGHPIPAAMLARQFRTSIIPVREALNRLTGERLVEACENNGFFAPRISEVRLRDLYKVQLGLVLCELERRDLPNIALSDIFDPRTEASPMAGLDMLFTLLADTSSSREVRYWLRNANDRLHPVYLRKPEVQENWQDECARLLETWQRGNVDDFTQALMAYHERRLELVPALVERMAQPPMAHEIRPSTSATN